LEALGIGVELAENDVAVRGNFCTVDDMGIIADRRAGRISTEKCRELCTILGQIKIGDVELFVWPVRDHRFSLVLRGNELAAEIYDTDPQKTGLFPSRGVAMEKRAERTAELVNEFIEKAGKALAHYKPANMILLRGFSKLPVIPSLDEIYKLNPAAIARYPMYKGLARLMGMKVYDADSSIAEEFEVLTECFGEHDFFFIHIKETDSAGEDGNFKKKVETIAEVDSLIPQLLDLSPDVVVVTGDHSTPALLKSHSWHPVPCLVYSQWCRPDKVTEFSELACESGSLGRFSAMDIMPLAMANALKLKKYGA
jgi:2,3-bisphosphoglycerate-independent phosphoglycerate mutase